MKKFQGKSSTVIWCIASVCAVLSLVYYLSAGNGIVISIVSAFVVLFLSMIVVSVVVGVVTGVMELFSPSKKQAEQENSSLNEPITETFDVAGTHYCMQNIMKLATRNPDWKKTGKALVKAGYAGKQVFRYTYINKPVKLIPEPQNPHDPNAVMVQIAGEKVGYISAEEAPHVNDVLKHRKIIYISSFIGGGDQKYIEEDGTFERRDGEPYVHVRIKYK